MIATTAAILTSLFQCHVADNGNAVRCGRIQTAGRELSFVMPPRTTLAVNGRYRYLYSARVGGRRGRWNYARTRLLWQDYRVQFDGVGFVNYTYHPVRISVKIDAWTA